MEFVCCQVLGTLLYIFNKVPQVTNKSYFGCYEKQLEQETTLEKKMEEKIYRLYLVQFQWRCEK